MLQTLVSRSFSASFDLFRRLFKTGGGVIILKSTVRGVQCTCTEDGCASNFKGSFLFMLSESTLPLLAKISSMMYYGYHSLFPDEMLGATDYSVVPKVAILDLPPPPPKSPTKKGANSLAYGKPDLLTWERWSYFKGAQFYYNLFDWFGLILVLIVIPLRFSGHDAQRVLASFGFFFNVLRLFRYSCITRGFNKVMLSGVRALVEQQPAADDYTRYKWLPVCIILVYMTAVVVILLNILIAQMSSTYSTARKTARLQYDVDRMLIITRLEHSRFHKFNLRLNYYQEDDVIDEMTLAKDLLEYSEDRSPWESIEDKLDEIRNIMRKIIKRIPLPDD